MISSSSSLSSPDRHRPGAASPRYVALNSARVSTTSGSSAGRPRAHVVKPSMTSLVTTPPRSSPGNAAHHAGTPDASTPTPTPARPAEPARVEPRDDRSESGSIAAEPAVRDEVVPGAVAPLRSAQDALAGEPGLLQRSLFRPVLDVGERLDPVHEIRREQVVGEHPLRGPAHPLPPALRQQPDADVVRPRLDAGAVLLAVPADVADDLAGVVDDQEHPLLG